MPVRKIKAVGVRGRTEIPKDLNVPPSTANAGKALNVMQQRAVIPSQTAKPKIIFNILNFLYYPFLAKELIYIRFDTTKSK